MLKEQIDSLLDRVQKPARYMGGEMNCVLKDPSSVDIRYAFAFPDVYEVGMSHLGSRILYDIIRKTYVLRRVTILPTEWGDLFLFFRRSL